MSAKENSKAVVDIDLNQYLTIRDLLEVIPYDFDTRNRFKNLVERMELRPSKVIQTDSLEKDRFGSFNGRPHKVKLNCYNLVKLKSRLEKHIATFTYTTNTNTKQFTIKVLEVVNSKIKKIEEQQNESIKLNNNAI